MSAKALKLVGLKFGRLLVLNFAGINSDGKSKWECLCDCGSKCTAEGRALKRQRKSSCGCLRVENCFRHGHAGTKKSKPSPTYLSWLGMIARCSNPKHQYYARYGGRGISVCERWRDFSNFLADMGKRPHGKTIDRINNDGNYEQENCRWATPEEQRSNRSDSASSGQEPSISGQAARSVQTLRSECRSCPDQVLCGG